MTTSRGSISARGCRASVSVAWRNVAIVSQAEQKLAGSVPRDVFGLADSCHVDAASTASPGRRINPTAREIRAKMGIAFRNATSSASAVSKKRSTSLPDQSALDPSVSKQLGGGRRTRGGGNALAVMLQNFLAGSISRSEEMRQAE